MKKFIILIFFHFSYAYDPSKISQEDVDSLKTFPIDVYQKSIKTFKLSPTEILEFIWKNRLIKINPLLENLQIGVIGFAGGRNLNGGIYNLESDSNLDPYAYVGLQARLNIIDPLESRKKTEEIQKQRIVILNLILKLQNLKIKYDSSKTKLEILLLKENRLKVRISQAVSHLDERIQNLDEIHEISEKLSIYFLDFQTKKQQILEYVTEESKQELKEILGDLK